MAGEAAVEGHLAAEAVGPAEARAAVAALVVEAAVEVPPEAVEGVTTRMRSRALPVMLPAKVAKTPRTLAFLKHFKINNDALKG